MISMFGYSTEKRDNGPFVSLLLSKILDVHCSQTFLSTINGSLNFLSCAMYVLSMFPLAVLEAILFPGLTLASTNAPITSFIW